MKAVPTVAQAFLNFRRRTKRLCPSASMVASLSKPTATFAQDAMSSWPPSSVKTSDLRRRQCSRWVHYDADARLEHMPRVHRVGWSNLSCIQGGVADELIVACRGTVEGFSQKSCRTCGLHMARLFHITLLMLNRRRLLPPSFVPWSFFVDAMSFGSSTIPWRWLHLRRAAARIQIWMREPLPRISCLLTLVHGAGGSTLSPAATGAIKHRG